MKNLKHINSLLGLKCTNCRCQNSLRFLRGVLGVLSGSVGVCFFLRTDQTGIDIKTVLKSTLHPEVNNFLRSFFIQGYVKLHHDTGMVLESAPCICGCLVL